MAGLNAASFVDFNVVHEAQNVIAISAGIFFFSLGEALAEIVAESARFHVGLEPGFFVVGAGDTIFAGPGEGVFVGSSGGDLRFQVVVIDAQELAGPEVHTEAEVGVELGMKGSGVVFAHLVTEAGEVNDPVEFVAGGAWHFITVCHGPNEAVERRLFQRKTLETTQN